MELFQAAETFEEVVRSNQFRRVIGGQARHQGEGNMRDFGPFAVGMVAIAAWMVITVTRIISRNRVREMQIRERIALIEKGLVPPPEVDPAGFERAMRRHEGDPWQRRHSPGRHLRVGIILIGVGVGLMLIIAAGSGSIRIAIGPGGFLVALGLAFVLIGLFDSPVLSANSSTPPPSSAPAPPDTRRPD